MKKRFPRREIKKGLKIHHGLLNVPIDKNWTIQQLVKFTNRELEFSDENKSVQIILRGLGNIVHGGTELRNQYGSGHGHLSEFKNMDIIFSKLVVSSATAFILFYLEYWKNNINEG